MRAPGRLCRYVRSLVADLAAEYGEVELVREHRTVSIGEYDDTLAGFETFNQIGGASAWVLNPDGEALLVRPEPGDPWTDPGAGLEPGEGYEACARRAVRTATGLEVTVAGLERVHVFVLDDGTRPPVPDVAVVFRARGQGIPSGDASEADWFGNLPADLAYPALAELPVASPPA